MSIIPGLSTQQRLEIQLKLDKIISQDFLNICPHFAQKNENFNLKLSKYILSSENCKFNSNLAKNFHFKIYNLHKIEHMNEFESCLYKPKRLLIQLFNNFTTSELMIILSNLKVFVKNERIRKYFPIIKNESIEDIFENKSTDENYQKKFLPILIPNKKKNKEVKITLKKNLIKDVNSLILNDKQKKIEEHNNEEKRKKILNDILNESNRQLFNIPYIIKKERINHPLIEYYMNERRKMRKSCSTSILYNKPNIKKYQELHDINLKQINYLNTIKSNLLMQNNLNNKLKINRNKS